MNIRNSFFIVAKHFLQLSGMTIFRKVIFIYILLLFGNVHSQVNLKSGHLYDTHKLIVFEGIGPTLTKSDFSEVGMGYNIKAGVEYYWKNFGLHYLGGRVSANMMELSADDPGRIPNNHNTNIYSLNFGILYGIRLYDKLYSYASLGLTATYFDPRDNNRNKLPGNSAGQYDKLTSDYFFEAGVKFRIDQNFLLYGEGSLYMHPDDLIDDNPVNSFPDFYGTINFGLSYAFTFEEDSDDDGVSDQWDKCPHTPSNVEVDEFGCPVDDDLDGVPDYRDSCPDSPIGIEVDRFGCLFDSDRDGVADYIDKCDDTPANVVVDSLGCPVDSDNDGVPDYLDLCPDTEAGVEVDSSGCYVIDESKNFLESIIVNFNSGSVEIDERFFPRLDRVSFYMNEYSDIIWYIEGHSDNIERYEGGETISLARAKSVLDYLLRKGVSLSKLRIVDRENSFNIADNATAQGREKNRRVVIFGIK